MKNSGCIISGVMAVKLDASRDELRFEMIDCMADYFSNCGPKTGYVHIRLADEFGLRASISESCPVLAVDKKFEACWVGIIMGKRP